MKKKEAAVKRPRGRPITGAIYPVRFVVQVSEAVREALRARAAEESRSIAQVVREAISMHLKRPPRA